MNKKDTNRKKLKLNTETLRQLAETDLKNVAGQGAFSFLGSCPCHQTDDC